MPPSPVAGFWERGSQFGSRERKVAVATLRKVVSLNWGALGPFFARSLRP